MKYVLLLLSTALFAQVEEKRIEVYSFVNGIRSAVPTEVIIKKEDRTEVYRLNNGIQPINPYRVIDNRGYIFEPINGIMPVNPVQKIEFRHEFFVPQPQPTATPEVQTLIFY